MTHLKITRTKEGLAVVLNDEIEQLLGVADGSEVAFEVSYQRCHALTCVAQSLVAMEAIRPGSAVSLFQASQQASTMAS